jgi:hypothetical protein
MIIISVMVFTLFRWIESNWLALQTLFALRAVLVPVRETINENTLMLWDVWKANKFLAKRQ